jgi:hypothetical protein
MGLKDRVRSFFENEEPLPIEQESEETESSEDHKRFLALAKEITDDILEDLMSDEEDPVKTPEAIMVSEYDVGTVEVEQLSVDEAELTNYNEVNVIQHESFEDIVEHLEGAEILGDISEEVQF